MNIQIEKKTDYLQKNIYSTMSGYVHSVYHKTINIKVENMLFALQIKGSPISPISLITELSETDFSNLSVKQGDYVSFSSHKFQIHSSQNIYSFDLSFSDVQNTLLTSVISSKKLSLIQEAIDQSTAGGFRNLFTLNNASIPDNEFLSLPAAKHIIENSTSLIHRQSFKEASVCLSQLLGCGIGLTPSGDDFLCGVLAGSILSEKKEHSFYKHLKQTLFSNLDKTNDISHTFLKCALDGYFSSAINQISFTTSGKEICKEFEKIGHSSGMDSLSGILYAWRIREEIEKNI